MKQLNKGDIFVIASLAIILSCVIFVVIVLIAENISSKNTLSQCKEYNFTQHFEMIQGFTLMSNFNVKSVSVLNQTSSTIVCKVDVDMCFDSLRMCWDGSLYSQEMNKTYV